MNIGIYVLVALVALALVVVKKTILSEHRIEFTCHSIHLHVLPTYLLRFSHPNHQ